MKSRMNPEMVLKAALGEKVYEEVKKFIPAWKQEYAETKPRIGWMDFLEMKIAEGKGLKTWNVYRAQEKVGTTKALTAEEAVKKLATVVQGELTARQVMVSTMKF